MFRKRRVKMYVSKAANESIWYSRRANRLTRARGVDAVTASNLRLAFWGPVEIEYYDYVDLQRMSVEYSSIPLPEWPGRLFPVPGALSEYDILQIPETLLGPIAIAGIAYSAVRRLPKAQIMVSLTVDLEKPHKEFVVYDTSPEMLYALNYAYKIARDQGVDAYMNNNFAAAYSKSPAAKVHEPVRRRRWY